MTSLRIIKRGDKYVVQIGISRWWSRKLKWVGLWYRVFENLNHPLPGGLMPKFPPSYDSLADAKAFCIKYLTKEELKKYHSVRGGGECVVKTYNAGLPAPMPECKPAKETCANCLDKFCDYQGSRVNDKCDSYVGEIPDTLCGLPIKIVDCGAFEVSIQTSSNATFEILTGEDIDKKRGK